MTEYCTKLEEDNKHLTNIIEELNKDRSSVPINNENK